METQKYRIIAHVHLYLPNFRIICLAWIVSLMLEIVIIPLGTAQSLQKDIIFLLEKRPKPIVFNIKHESPPKSVNEEKVSELKLLVLGAIRLYQLTLSSQDIPACNYVPSCSRFCSAALQRAGLMRGLLLTSDRLQRCNGLPGKIYHYKFIPSIHKFADPIEHYLESSAHESIAK